MNLFGHNVTKKLLDKIIRPQQFERGPITFVAYLPENIKQPVLMLFLNGQTYIKKFPIKLEIEDTQNYIEFKIMECDEEMFCTFMIKYKDNRYWIKLTRGKKINNTYKLFPNGELVRTH